MNVLRRRQVEMLETDEQLRAEIIREGTIQYLRRTPPLTEGILTAGGLRRAVALRRVRQDTKLRERYATELT